MVYSAIEIHTRLEIQDLLNRFCHSLQHCDLAMWDEIFARHATFSSQALGEFSDVALRLIPELVRDLGDGAWRFHLFDLVLAAGARRKSVIAKACLAVVDCGDDCAPKRITDCRFELQLVNWWHIASFEEHSVGKMANPGIADVAASRVGRHISIPF